KAPVPPPEPLGLPKPRTPPPRINTPYSNRPPEPIPPPVPRAQERDASAQEEDAKPVRWWTEWLCGCSEGPDRGGEVQVSVLPLTLVLSPVGPTRLSNSTLIPSRRHLCIRYHQTHHATTPILSAFSHWLAREVDAEAFLLVKFPTLYV
ncbi:hypothetical protein EW146_g9928, partial [Bondarzewia mesenterica]